MGKGIASLVRLPRGSHFHTTSGRRRPTNHSRGDPPMVSAVESHEPGLSSMPALARDGARPTRVVLVGCVKRKQAGMHRARDLYASPLWRARRGYAEQTGSPWFILSALHELVDPDEPLAPYDFALADMPRAERRTWADGVVAGLERRLGAIAGIVFEIHAGGAYRGVLEPALLGGGATLESPTAGIRGVGSQLAWYARLAGMLGNQAAMTEGDAEFDVGAPSPDSTSPAAESRRCVAAEEEVEAALDALDRDPVIVRASDWPPSLGGLDRPGLYSWSVDERGAEMLSRGLGHDVAAGRIYAGLTGATKWPSGNTGKNTLHKRIRGHIGGNVAGSTLRLLLASVLSAQLGLQPDAPKPLRRASEKTLELWIRAHLSVAVHPVVEPDSLADLERRVLAHLDPPLNLNNVNTATPVRARLQELRRACGEP